MLQVVFMAIFIGIGLIQIPKEKGKPVQQFFESLTDVVIKLVDIIMLMAPIGVFALIAQTINKVAGNNPSEILELLGALGYYMFAVIVGLIAHAAITYTGIMRLMTKMPLETFYKGIAPAQLLGSYQLKWSYVASNHGACEEELGVGESIIICIASWSYDQYGWDGFYQASAVLIAQTLNMSLDISAHYNRTNHCLSIHRYRVFLGLE